MQEIIITTTVEIPNCPLFEKGQKVRVKDELADLLVDRGHARFNQGKPATTEKAKKIKEERDKKDGKIVKDKK